MAPISSRAAVQVGPGQLETQSIEVKPVDEDGGLMRVEACGLCGTDLDQFRDASRTRTYPLIPGHEAVGTIAALGTRAQRRWGLKLGQRIIVEPLIPCWVCGSCRSGNSRLCIRRRSAPRAYSNTPISEWPALWGGYAEYLYLDPGAAIHRIPAHLPAEIAVMANSLANAIEWTLLTPGTKFGDNVVVLGCGQRGLMSVIALRAAGVRNVITTGLSADHHKLEMARRLGADAAVDIEQEDLLTVVRDVTSGAMADVVVDMTPNAVESISTAVDLAREGGVIVIAGLKGGRHAAIDTDKLVRKGLRIQTGLSARFDAFEQAIGLLVDHTERFRALHTRSYSLDNVTDALRALSGEDGNGAICVSLSMT